MATINQFGNKQQPVLADLLHLWSTGSATDMNINLEQLRDLMIGTLANLDTTDKASIVAAINELNGPVKYMAGKPRNSEYNGRNLKEVFGTAAAFAAAVFAGDFSQIEDGDYWPLELSGSVHDYSLSSDYTKTINATMKIEVMINPYWKYGDSGKIADGYPHLLMCSRDLLPWTLKMRADNSTWYNSANNPDSTKNPWLGSALYETLNNTTDGLLKLVLQSELGDYVHLGPNSKGMRSLMENKAAAATSASNWGWYNRGVLFLPTEKEVWGNTTWANPSYGGAAALQWPIFAGNRRHIIKGLGEGGSRYYWWCESSNEGDATDFCFVDTSGNPNYAGAGNALGVPLCFLLAANA